MIVDEDTLVTVATAVEDEDLDSVVGYVEEIARVLAEAGISYELLLIHNGSSDAVCRSVEALQRRFHHIRYLRLSHFYDRETVFIAALDQSIGDYVVLMDLNSDPPALIPELLETSVSGYDAVIGKQEDGRRDEPLLRRVLARVFYRLLGSMTGSSIDPATSNFRVFSRRAVNSITRIKDKTRYMKYFTEYVGYQHRYVPYRPIQRSGRPRRMSYLEALNLGVSTIVANSNVPLRMVSLVGLGASFINLLYALYVLMVSVLEEAVPGISLPEGWASTNLFTAVMFFVLFLMLAVLAEYVMKILNETQQRPLYYISYESNSSVSEHYRDALNVV